MPDVKLAVQLYTLRDAGLAFDDLLATVARAGYDGVETVGTHGLTGHELRDALARHGLSGSSAHVQLAALRDDVDACLATYLEAGIDTLVVPFLAPDARPADTDGWTGLGRELGRLARRCEAAGARLLYHNHDFEFAAVGDGIALTHLLGGSEPLGLELDLGWAVRAGADPDALLARYAGRVPRVHVKDLAGDGDAAEGGWADVGHGTVEWPPLLRAARRAGAEWWIVEHDAPRDPVASVRRSATYLREVVRAL